MPKMLPLLALLTTSAMGQNASPYSTSVTAGTATTFMGEGNCAVTTANCGDDSCVHYNIMRYHHNKAWVDAGGVGMTWTQKMGRAGYTDDEVWQHCYEDAQRQGAKAFQVHATNGGCGIFLDQNPSWNFGRYCQGQDPSASNYDPTCPAPSPWGGSNDFHVWDWRNDAKNYPGTGPIVGVSYNANVNWLKNVWCYTLNPTPPAPQCSSLAKKQCKQAKSCHTATILAGTCIGGVCNQGPKKKIKRCIDNDCSYHQSEKSCNKHLAQCEYANGSCQDRATAISGCTDIPDKKNCKKFDPSWGCTFDKQTKRCA